MGGLPSGGIVGENRSTQSKTTVRSKRVGPLGSNGVLLLGSHSVIFLLVFIFFKVLFNTFNLKILFTKFTEEWTHTKKKEKSQHRTGL